MPSKQRSVATWLKRGQRRVHPERAQSPAPVRRSPGAGAARGYRKSPRRVCLRALSDGAQVRVLTTLRQTGSWLQVRFLCPQGSTVVRRRRAMAACSADLGATVEAISQTTLPVGCLKALCYKVVVGPLRDSGRLCARCWRVLRRVPHPQPLRHVVRLACSAIAKGVASSRGLCARRRTVVERSAGSA